MVPLIYLDPVKAGNTNSIWDAWRKAKPHTDPPWASCHTPQAPSPVFSVSCGAERQWSYASFLASFPFRNAHYNTAIFGEMRQGMYALACQGICHWQYFPNHAPAQRGWSLLQGNDNTKAKQCFKNRLLQPWIHRDQNAFTKNASCATPVGASSKSTAGKLQDPFKLARQNKEKNN